MKLFMNIIQNFPGWTWDDCGNLTIDQLYYMQTGQDEITDAGDDWEAFQKVVRKSEKLEKKKVNRPKNT